MTKIVFDVKFRSFAILLVWMLCVFVCLTSCATRNKIEYIDKEVEKIVVKEIHDTVRESLHDSIVIKERGDTSLIERWHTKYRDRIVETHDTVRNDSIQVQYKETVKEVVKYPKTYWAAVCVSILFFIFAFVKLIKWIQTL